ncbi:MAG: isocitrate dehydrogenase [Deltaproteobacteria bacterium HGW-Deltaproteobacteria-14]|jgi:isocitrate dehydrogenase (NAD+)|nr:MAG: isocitrate dehydrogenase [Deltaproteobacteria bacterium HGW-Deltaproteobacteria-14]
MTRTVTLIPGDGVGPELARATRRLLDAAGADVAFAEVTAGRKAYEATGDPVPAEVIAAIRDHGVALKGLIGTPHGAGYESPNVRLRKELDLFAAVRPVRLQPGLRGRYDAVDFVVIREATEDVYSGIEHEVVPGVVQSIKVTTRAACERIIRFAFEYAISHQRKKLTLIHKANIMKISDGLFLRCGRELSADYPQIAFEALIADNASMQLVRDPARYDVIVAMNLFGDLLADLGAGLVGGVSNVWGSLRGETDLVVFEAVTAGADALVGLGIANPLPFIRPAVAMLRHIGDVAAADRIDAAVGRTLGDGVRTKDSGGAVTTEGMVDAIVARL